MSCKCHTDCTTYKCGCYQKRQGCTSSCFCTIVKCGNKFTMADTDYVDEFEEDDDESCSSRVEIDLVDVDDEVILKKPKENVLPRSPRSVTESKDKKRPTRRTESFLRSPQKRLVREESATSTNKVRRVESTWGEVEKAYNITIIKGSIVPPSTTDISLSIHFIKAYLCHEETTQMYPFPGPLESLRYSFIINCITTTLKQYSPFLKMSPLRDNGNIILNLAVVSNSPQRVPLMIVIPTHRNDIEDGRASCYPLLKFIWEDNRRVLAVPVFGCITSADLWVFVVYDGNRWVEDRPIPIIDSKDEDGVSKLLRSLDGIFGRQMERCREHVTQQEQLIYYQNHSKTKEEAENLKTERKEKEETTNLLLQQHHQHQHHNQRKDRTSQFATLDGLEILQKNGNATTSSYYPYPYPSTGQKATQKEDKDTDTDTDSILGGGGGGGGGGEEKRTSKYNSF